jgi:hypothetical protein
MAIMRRLGLGIQGTISPRVSGFHCSFATIGKRNRAMIGGQCALDGRFDVKARGVE